MHSLDCQNIMPVPYKKRAKFGDQLDIRATNTTVEKVTKLKKTKIINDDLEFPTEKKRVVTPNYAGTCGKLKDKKTDNLKNTIDKAREFFQEKDYQKASEMFLRVMDNKEVNFLQAKYYMELLKELFLSQMEQWQNETDVETKRELIVEARKSLEKYLDTPFGINNKTPVKNNTELLYNFATRVYLHAIKECEQYPISAFENMKHVLEVDLKYSAYIEPMVLDGLIEEIVWNMNNCIQEEDQQMKDKMTKIYKHPLVQGATRKALQGSALAECQITFDRNREEQNATQKSIKRSIDAIVVDDAEPQLKRKKQIVADAIHKQDT